ncbi:MAG TPA: hypothetical protein VLY45_06610 [Nitrospiria bacterium]|nr:hypothetical protein [Nitrospiria bacterium]
MINGWWTVFLSFLGIKAWLYSDMFSASTLLIFAVLFGVILLDLSRSKEWAWWASSIAMTFILIVSVPIMVYDCYLFITDNGLHPGVPAPISVAVTDAILFVIPALASVISLFSERKRFFSPQDA